jgi:3-oxoacyl-(acyl-carrier-protein) synthase
MKRRRVKITGIGPVTPAGIGKEAFAAGISQEISRVRIFSALEPELGPFVAAYIDRFKIEDYISRSAVPKGAARHTLFAVAGAVLAMQDARLSLREFNESNCVVVAGSSVMDFDGIGKTVEGVISKGVRGALGRTVYTANAACIAATVSQVLGFNARSMTIQSSCCTGLDAVGYAARLIASGEAEYAICGGSEAPLYRCPLVELRAVGLTPATVDAPAKISRPFDLWRTTGVVSEGACMFVLEPESSPRPGYSFVSGYSFAKDPSDELCGGMVFAARQALADAGVRPSQVTAINCWGPGHKYIDSAEASALEAVFGKSLFSIPAVSIKGSIGSPLGAAPAIQIGAAAIGQVDGFISPTVNWKFPDPSCPLNLSARLRPIPHDITLINAHGLSGVNAALVMHRC